MSFKNTPPDWQAEGIEPTPELRKGGFPVGYKPPAAYFNWFWTKVSKCIAELQAKVAENGGGTDGYVPTAADKTEIAQIAISDIADGDEVLYG